MAKSDDVPIAGESAGDEVAIGVHYGYQTYGGTLRLTAVEVVSDPFAVHIKLEGLGYSRAEKSLVEICGGWLTLPPGLAREVGEQLVQLSGGPPDKWRKDYPEEAERQRRQRLRELESAIRQLRGQARGWEAESS